MGTKHILNKELAKLQGKRARCERTFKCWGLQCAVKAVTDRL